MTQHLHKYCYWRDAGYSSLHQKERHSGQITQWPSRVTKCWAGISSQLQPKRAQVAPNIYTFLTENPWYTVYIMWRPAGSQEPLGATWGHHPMAGRTMTPYKPLRQVTELGGSQVVENPAVEDPMLPQHHGRDSVKGWENTEKTISPNIRGNVRPY